MPTTVSARPATRTRRSAPASSEDAVADLHNATTVQDRIRQWQTNGDIALPPDAISTTSPPRSTVLDNVSVSESVSEGFDHAKPKSRSESRGRESKRLADIEREEWIRRGRASTPRKRVVSDEHWRKKTNSASRIETKTKSINEQVELDTKSTHHKSHGSASKARAERDERRRRRTEARRKKAEAEDRNSGETARVAISPEPSSFVVTQASEFVDGNEIDSNAQQQSERILDEENFKPDPWGNATSVLEEEYDEEGRGGGVWHTSKYATTLGRPPLYEQYGTARPKKSVLHKTKEMLGMNESALRTSNRLPSIEAWLEEQPDPFQDQDEYAITQGYVEGVDVPRPLKTVSSRRRRQEEKRPNEPVTDPNGIWDSIDSYEGEGTPLGSKTDIPSVRHQREQELLPAALRRRGAKSSRMKQRVSAEKTTQAPINEQFSSTERALSPPRGLEQRNEGHSPVLQEFTTQTIIPPPIIPDHNAVCSLKRKLTTHEDLMSQLSLIKPSRSSRKPRETKGMDRKSDEEVIQQILDTVKEDEVKYGRELRTLVDGVIPVLLQCVLSKGDSIAKAALFMSTAETGLSFARPVVDMGIALERLKSLHRRIPLHSVDSLLSWSQTAHKAYTDYLRAWRLGFQDVIVNLAPLTGEQDERDEIMARDDSGDVVDTEGDKVDVAFLLKRPLIRIRKLSKALCALRQRLKQHPVISKIADDFVDLEAQAKQKYQQEQGRLEDAAAASIDTHKVRDIRTFGTLSGVQLDKTRRVRARDTFNMTIYHSTGQRIDSRVELVLRDNQQAHVVGGDLLICHVDTDGKWLLFAPVEVGYVSARRGESGCDLVLMVRGAADLRSEWHELLALNAEEPEAVADWMNMLGSNPLPPKLSRLPSFISAEDRATVDELPVAVDLTMSNLQRVASVETFDVPLGEPSIIETAPLKAQVDNGMRRKVEQDERHEHITRKLNLGGALQPRSIPEHWHHQRIDLQSQKAQHAQSPDPSLLSGYTKSSAERSDASSPSNTARPRSTPHKHVQFAPSITPSLDTLLTTPSAARHRLQSSHSQAQSASASTTLCNASDFADEVESPTTLEHVTPTGQQDRVLPDLVVQESFSGQTDQSQAVSMPLSGGEPLIPKTRQAESRKSLSSIPLTDSIRETWAALSGRGKKAASTPNSPVKKKRPVSTPGEFKVLSPPIQPRNDFTASDLSYDSAQSTALSELSLASGQRSQSVPTPQAPELYCKLNKHNAPLSSSPLKHEYAPLTASESPDDEDEIDYSDDASSDTSEDLFSELKDEARSLPDMARTDRRSLSREPSNRPSATANTATTTGTRTLAPSDSASQGPYRRVPSSAAYPRDKIERASATICSWSDKGMWEPIRNDDCSIVVSPGLIEAFAIEDDVHAGEIHSAQPLVAFELTPLVPLRKGTALDITIRSPPTAHSQIKTTNNVMFRSRTMIECENLYRMINWARCNNPTYIELERARPRPQPDIKFSNQEAPRPKSWFSFGSGPRRRNSFRAGSMPPPSMPDSVASSGTMSNALSTLKRLSKTSAFSINRSSVIRRPGRGTNVSLYSSDTNTMSGSGSSTPAPPTQIGFAPGKDGPNVPLTSAEAVNGAGMVNNMKMKLYLRDGRDWTELGPAQLSVLPAPLVTTTIPNASRPGSSSGSIPSPAAAPVRRSSGLPARREYRLPSSSYTPHRIHGHGHEKRIVVTQQNRPDMVLLDETLGESCFEKVAERGIAVKVWTEDEAMRTQGGVLTGRGRVYMMKFKSQSEASWVFGLCGTYRYSTVTAM